MARSGRFELPAPIFVVFRTNMRFYSFQITLIFLNISIRSLTMPVAPLCARARVVVTANTINPTMTRSFFIFMLLKTSKIRSRS